MTLLIYITISFSSRKLAEEILRLSNDADHYAATVEKCLARAKEYDISKMVAEHINLYQDILRIQ